MLGFDRFAEGAQEAATRAYEIMIRYGHTQLDTEHILLALLEQPESTAKQVLGELKVNLERLRQRVEASLKEAPRLATPGPVQPQQVYITPRVKMLMDRSGEEALRLKSDLISTEHLMLAILADGDGAAARLLAEEKVTYQRFEAALRDPQGGARPVAAL